MNIGWFEFFFNSLPNILIWRSKLAIPKVEDQTHSKTNLSCKRIGEQGYWYRLTPLFFTNTHIPKVMPILVWQTPRLTLILIWFPRSLFVLEKPHTFIALTTSWLRKVRYNNPMLSFLILNKEVRSLWRSSLISKTNSKKSWHHLVKQKTRPKCSFSKEDHTWYG